jgi:hypothetical protein
LRLAPSRGRHGLSPKAHSAHPTSTSRTGYDEDSRRKLVRRITVQAHK